LIHALRNAAAAAIFPVHALLPRWIPTISMSCEAHFKSI